MYIFVDADACPVVSQIESVARNFEKLLQSLCLLVLLVLCLYPGPASAQVAGAVRDTAAVAAAADGRSTDLSPAVCARAALKNRIFLKYREMAVISDAQYRITQTAIRDNRAHQTPLHTSELLFNKCMHDGRYSEAAIIASLAVFDSDTPVERAHFTLLQAEACLLRQDDLHAIWPLLQQASNELASAAGTHDDSWQQAKAMLDEMQDALLTN